MSESLSAKEFRTFVELYTENHAEVMKTLEDHTQRLDRLEHLLWHGEKLDRLEARVIKLAEKTGFPDLAVPLSPPIGQ